jgi:hypothetical protein
MSKLMIPGPAGDDSEKAGGDEKSAMDRPGTPSATTRRDQFLMRRLACGLWRSWPDWSPWAC